MKERDTEGRRVRVGARLLYFVIGLFTRQKSRKGEMRR